MKRPSFSHTSSILTLDTAMDLDGAITLTARVLADLRAHGWCVLRVGADMSRIERMDPVRELHVLDQPGIVAPLDQVDVDADAPPDDAVARIPLRSARLLECVPSIVSTPDPDERDEDPP